MKIKKTKGLAAVGYFFLLIVRALLVSLYVSKRPTLCIKKFSERYDEKNSACLTSNNPEFKVYKKKYCLS